MSGRPRGMPSRSAINLQYPHQVAVGMVDGRELGLFRRTGPLSSLCQWTAKVHDGERAFEIFCFSDSHQSLAFRDAIGGETFDPRDQVGHRWERGRGARRDAK